jgi:hypothetical protein
MTGSGFSLSAQQREYELERAADGTAAQVPAGSRRKGAQAETVVNGYISREFLGDPALLPLVDETSLLDSGILDSLSLRSPEGLPRLVAFPEKRFGITMGKADLLRENFTSAKAICACLRAREPGNEEAAHG